MATNLNISENQERVPLRVGGGGLLRTINPDNGSPYYVGARAYVTQTSSGAIVTVIDKDGTTTAVILNGADGQDGQDGNGIVDITLTSSAGNVDTYTITYDNGDTDTFNVTNGADGVSITGITKTGTSGNVDTYTISYSDGNSDTFTVTNGIDGYSPSASVTKSGNAATITITDENGTTTSEVYDGAGVQLIVWS